MDPAVLNFTGIYEWNPTWKSPLEAEMNTTGNRLSLNFSPDVPTFFKNFACRDLEKNKNKNMLFFVMLTTSTNNRPVISAMRIFIAVSEGNICSHWILVWYQYFYLHYHLPFLLRLKAYSRIIETMSKDHKNKRNNQCDKTGLPYWRTIKYRQYNTCSKLCNVHLFYCLITLFISCNLLWVSWQTNKYLLWTHDQFGSEKEDYIWKGPPKENSKT